MLVLRLLVMVLSIICLMDGHAEVSSSTTGNRVTEESPIVKKNEMKDQILDRKKKKPKKNKKPKKTKPKKPKIPKRPKPATTTPSITTSNLKTTTSTETTSTASITTTTTSSATTTTYATTIISTTTSSASTTKAATTSTSKTTVTTATPTVVTSSPSTIAQTTDDTGAGEGCKTTDGKPCIFPFKDGNEEYNECKDHGGKYYWCATKVYESGKYMYWSYCPTDGSCPLPVKTTTPGGGCKTINNEPCIFPFKDGKKEYNDCADYRGSYFWCATATDSNGKFTSWEKCSKDGSCSLPGQTTIASGEPTSTTPPPDSLTTGTSEATIAMENKVVDSLGDLMIGESRSGSLEMFHLLDKKLENVIEDLEGDNESHKTINSDMIKTFPLKTLGGATNKSIGPERMYNVGFGWAFDVNSVTELGSVKKGKNTDCCSECKKEYSQTVLLEYWDIYNMNTCFCLKRKEILNIYGETLLVKPRTVPHSTLLSDVCDSQQCTISSPFDCPASYEFVMGGFPWWPVHSSNLIMELDVDSICKCRSACDKKEGCNAFYFATCNDYNKKNCLLLRNVKPEDPFTHYKKYAFCKKGGGNTLKQFPYWTKCGIPTVTVAGVKTCTLLPANGGACPFQTILNVNEAYCENQLITIYNTAATPPATAPCHLQDRFARMSWITNNGPGLEPTRHEEFFHMPAYEYRCYSYSDEEVGVAGSHPWVHRYIWDAEKRIPVYAVVRISHMPAEAYYNADSFMSDDAAHHASNRNLRILNERITRPYIPCGNVMAPLQSDLAYKVPTGDEYTGFPENRGHLIARSFINTYFPGHHMLKRSAGQFMSNIFPQQEDCNKWGDWRDTEIEIYDYVPQCLNHAGGPGRFYAAYAVHPRTTYMSNIRKVESIFVMYCCLDAANNMLFGRAYRVPNPATPSATCKRTGFGWTIGQMFDAYQKTYPNPFEPASPGFPKANPCIIDFNINYPNFPDGDSGFHG